MTCFHSQAEKPNFDEINKLLLESDTLVVVDHLERSNVVAYTERKKRIIVLNQNNVYTQVHRDFVIAHMLGHLAKHQHDYRDNVDCFDPIKTYWDHDECEANNFAMQLMMSKIEIRRYADKIITEYLGKFDQNIPSDVFLSTMVSGFGVPFVWMEMRLKKLGFIFE